LGENAFFVLGRNLGVAGSYRLTRKFLVVQALP
jgi:hypothetical protein